MEISLPKIKKRVKKVHSNEIIVEQKQECRLGRIIYRRKMETE